MTCPTLGGSGLPSPAERCRSRSPHFACGSVVDALYPEDLEDLILPTRDQVDGEMVNAAWNDLAAAAEKARRATELIQSALVEGGI